MNNTVTIRTATVADAFQVSALVCRLAPSFLDHSDSSGSSVFFNSISPEAEASYISSPEFLYLLACHNDEIIGLIGMRNKSHLFHLFVAQAWQGKGIARLLWTNLLESINSVGYEGPFTVNASLNAVPVYVRFGFIPAGPARTENGVEFMPMQTADPDGVE